ncbi:MAG: pyridoxal-phosphate dependent enzyme, partial [Alphaproteobacteria bacterium]
FKARGAFNNLLDAAVPEAGVVAASGGNHGAAVAFAAQRLGIPARIFVPEISAPAKIARIQSCGATVVIGGARYADALAASEVWAAEVGALPVHAYDAPATLAGQGTTAREFAAQAPDLDTVLVAVGGGGLIGGMAAWYRGALRLVAVEPETSRALGAALAAGRPVDVEVSGIAADSLGARRVGNLMFPIARAYVDEAVTVPDKAIRAAQRCLWEALRIAAEPGGATALAALLCGAYQPRPGERIGVLVCGGNVDPASLA